MEDHRVTAGPGAIVCLDLDGTAVDFDALHAWFADGVADAVNAAVRHGAAWCPNSGRHAHNQYGMIQACRRLEALPFAVLAGERYIFDVDRASGALRARQPYNRLAKHKAREVTPRVSEVLRPHLADIAARGPLAEYFPSEEFVGWLLDESADPAAFVSYVRTLLAPVKEAQVLRNGRWVIVIHADFGKGRVLADAAEALGVPHGRILAVGDQQNDLDMLDGRCAAFVGCPGDADAEVKSAVERAGGWIADAPGAAGTSALIHRFIREVLA